MKIKAEHKIVMETQVEDVPSFIQQYPDAKILEVNNKKVDIFCESCYAPISIGDKCYAWNDLVYTCLKCGGGGEDHKPIILE